MKNSTCIYLMRHGLDDETFVGGWSCGGLIEEGRKQVAKATDFFLENNITIDKIYHSGLERTIESAKIINEKLNCEVYELNILKELNKGILNGMNLELAKKKYPEFFPNPSVEIKFPEGESLLDLYYRVKKFLTQIDDYSNSLLVTHRGFINMLYFILNDVSINYDKEQFNVDHGSVHRLQLEKITRIF